MNEPQQFSVKKVREMIKFLPGTYFGQRCIASVNGGALLELTAGLGEPIRFDAVTIALCCKGSVETEINLVSKKSVACELSLFCPGSISKLIRMSDDCELVGVTANVSELSDIFGGDVPSVFLHYGTDRSTLLSEREVELFRQIVSAYKQSLEVNGESSRVSFQLLSALIVFSRQALDKNGDGVQERASRSDAICREFLDLLRQSKGKQRSVSYYAEKLGVSNHYLSVSVKKSSGSSVKSLIERAVIAEIKVRLLYENTSINKIAEDMDFPGSSFLCKFFKTYTGMSPAKYRTINR